MNNKILTYLNFAKKSGTIIFGIDNIKASKNKLFCVLLSCDASQNLITSTKNFSETNNISFMQLDGTIDELLKTTNCKVIAISNQSLAEQILKLK